MRASDAAGEGSGGKVGSSLLVQRAASANTAVEIARRTTLWLGPCQRGFKMLSEEFSKSGHLATAFLKTKDNICYHMLQLLKWMFMKNFSDMGNI